MSILFGMSSAIPISLHPVVTCEDRYGGVYSGGAWWAVAQGDLPFKELSRIAWLWEHGPGSGDVDAAVFWGRPPPWIAAGGTSMEAIDNLLAKDRNDSDDWTPPPIEDDPRYRRSLFPARSPTT